MNFIINQLRHFLRSTYAIFILLFTVLLAGSTWLIWNQFDFHVRNDMLQQYRNITATIAEHSSKSTIPMLRSQDLLSLQVFTNELRNSQNLDSVTFYSPSQQVLAYANKKESTYLKHQVVSSKQITSGNDTLGSVHITMSTKPIDALLERTSQQIFIIAIAIWALGIIILRVMMFNYGNHIQQLAKQIKRIAFKKPLENLPQNTYSELSPIHQSLSELTENASHEHQIDNVLSRLLNQQIIDQTQQHKDILSPQIARTSSSIVYIRAHNLETVNKLDAASDSATLIAEYVTLVQQAAKLYNGFVDTQANGLAVVFGTPHEMPNHALHAICAASFLGRLFSNFNQKRQQSGRPALKLQISIHTGELYCYETPQQPSLAIFGEMIYEAAQLAQLAKPGQILISNVTKEQPDIEGKVQYKGPYKLATQSPNISSNYQVTGLETSYEKLIDHQVKHISMLSQPA